MVQYHIQYYKCQILGVCDVKIINIGCNARSSYITLLFKHFNSVQVKIFYNYTFCARKPFIKTNAIRKLPHFHIFSAVLTNKRNSCSRVEALYYTTNTSKSIISYTYSYNLVLYFFTIELNPEYKLTASAILAF